MRKNVFGIVSYNKYANYTNYGSALQSYALNKVVDMLGERYNAKAMFVDYCPDCLADKNPLAPFDNSWDRDNDMRQMIEGSMPAIRENYVKFMRFYDERFNHTEKSYTSENFNEIKSEGIDGFICGSDTIFCYFEFGLDDGYFANYPVMKNSYCVAYAPSFGDTDIDKLDKCALNSRLGNFKYIGLRESQFIPYVKENTKAIVGKVMDPTLLLRAEEYSDIIIDPKIKEKYILLYSRRYNPDMERFADKIAGKYNCKVVEISLRYQNADRHLMRYDAGVEEFLGLLKNAEYIITNSFHGMLFSLIFGKEFFLFSRQQCDTKNEEVLRTLGLQDRLLSGDADMNHVNPIDYGKVYSIIDEMREESLSFLAEELDGLNRFNDSSK